MSCQSPNNSKSIGNKHKLQAGEEWWGGLHLGESEDVHAFTYTCVRACICMVILRVNGLSHMHQGSVSHPCPCGRYCSRVETFLHSQGHMQLLQGQAHQLIGWLYLWLESLLGQVEAEQESPSRALPSWKMPE